MKKLFLFCNISAMMFLVSCKQQEHIESFDSEESNLVITTRAEKCFLSFRKYEVVVSTYGDDKMLNIYAINRTDSTNLKQMDSILIGRYERNIEFHLPFPLTVSFKRYKKSFFSSLKRTIEICRTHKYKVRNIKHQLGFSRIGKQRKRPVHLMMSGICAGTST
jgi:hypothetical protein